MTLVYAPVIKNGLFEISWTKDNGQTYTKRYRGVDALEAKYKFVVRHIPCRSWTERREWIEQLDAVCVEPTQRKNTAQ